MRNIPPWIKAACKPLQAAYFAINMANTLMKVPFKISKRPILNLFAAIPLLHLLQQFQHGFHLADALFYRVIDHFHLQFVSAL